ncbi:MAG: GDP-mannose 4,6-dehydratase [Candidatus Marsarchaeota archaeon]|nr:GDP-mannose 4,6-dehydratase [Candidatus Marsarchaeota archaeon]
MEGVVKPMGDDFYSDRRVLITGATGLVGGWLVKSLLAQGAELTCLVRDSAPHSIFRSERLDAKVNVVHAKLEDYFEVERTINEYESEVVIHLGAQAIVGTANRSPMGTFNSNIKGTWNVLEACRAHEKQLQSVVVASSDKAYGEQKTLPYTEDSPLHGENPYDCSKSCADLIAQCYGKTYGLPVSISRCGNFFGGGDLNFNRIVPGTIKSALEGKAPVLRSDGTYVRDYIYVKDAVSAYEFLAKKTAEKKFRGEAFNFSNESKLSVMELTKLILRRMGKESLKPIIKNEAKHEIHDQHLSAKKAREQLGWKSMWSIEKGLDETIAWYKEYFKAKKRASA